MNYYNDNDKNACAWLKELVKAGLIPKGEIDDRDIKDVNPTDLKGFTQCHFFAGIGGWSEALRLAQWPATRPVWTGSCPCQSLSVAGLGKGAEDERHLWPAFAELICKSKPSTVFGEQVASADGRQWLAGVRLDLEAMGYAVGAADLCAAGVGAPHIRSRLWWVANSKTAQRGGLSEEHSRGGASEVRGPSRITNNRLGNTIKPGLERLTRDGPRGVRDQRQISEQDRSTAETGDVPYFWQNFDLIPCADGKARRIESGSSPLAHGVPGRVGLLRGYGNAINPWVGAEFIKAYLGGRPCSTFNPT